MEANPFKIFFRAPYNYDTKKASDDAAAEYVPEPSMTVQAMAEDADLNVIMHRYGITGKMPENQRIPTYQDFDEIVDFRSAHEAVLRARDAFMEYPAELRAKFQNDPQRFMDYCADPKNLPEMRVWGLAVPEKRVETPPVVPPVETKT